MPDELAGKTWGSTDHLHVRYDRGGLFDWTRRPAPVLHIGGPALRKPDRSVYHARPTTVAYSPFRAAHRRLLEADLHNLFARHARTCGECRPGEDPPGVLARIA